MCKTLKKIYNGYVANEANSTAIYYDGFSLLHHTFDNLDFEDIKLYFKAGEKDRCIPDEQEPFFKGSGEEQWRVRHMFSVYLLGIYCYDNIPVIKKAFSKFIEEKIWKNTGECVQDEQKQQRRDFLYLWYLTAQFHDIGYMYEEKGDNDNSIYSFIIGRKNMMSKENLGFASAVLGIPQKLRYSAKDYFWQRRNNVMFNELLCTDHGFAGGYMLYKSLEKLHGDKREELKSPVSGNSLVFSPLIFQWYNVPSAWAIICHNIWTAAAGSGAAAKYEEFGLDKLIFAEGDSPVHLKDHPLLFLLDFVDTMDPFKRIGDIDKVRVETDANTMTLLFECPAEASTCEIRKKMLKKMDSSLDFLKSPTFQVEESNNKITFKFQEKA